MSLNLFGFVLLLICRCIQSLMMDRLWMQHNGSSYVDFYVHRYNRQYSQSFQQGPQLLSEQNEKTGSNYHFYKW